MTDFLFEPSPPMTTTTTMVKAPSFTKSSFGFDALDRATKTWVTKFNLNYISELSQLAIQVYPYLSFPSLCFANAIHVFLWILDDVVDEPSLTLEERQGLIQACMNTLTQYTSKTNDIMVVNDAYKYAGIIQFLNDLLQYTMSMALKLYLCEQLQDYFCGVLQHLQLPSDQILSVTAYTEIRVADGACEVVWPLCLLDESPSDIFTALLFMRSKEGMALRRYANLHVSYANDVLSYHKDLAQNTGFNVVFSFMKDDPLLTVQDATQKVIVLCNTIYTRLKHADNDVPLTITQFVSRLQRWCRGSLVWHKAAQRYKTND